MTYQLVVSQRGEVIKRRALTNKTEEEAIRFARFTWWMYAPGYDVRLTRDSDDSLVWERI